MSEKNSDPIEYVNHNKFTFIMIGLFVVVIILMLLASEIHKPLE